MSGKKNSEIRIHLVGKQDRKDNDYYYSVTELPAMVDLSRAVIFFFPGPEEPDGSFSGDLVIRKYKPEGNRQEQDPEASEPVRERPSRSSEPNDPPCEE